MRRAPNVSRPVCWGFVAFTMAMLFSSCSSFKKDWESALRQPIPTNTVTGPWEGCWISDKNGHKGRLRCLLEKQDGDTYTARFHAIYWKILRYRYSVPMTFQGTNDQATFFGEADLGWWAGGRYEYKGTVSPVHFHSTYRCKYDHGTFEMSRPQSAR